MEMPETLQAAELLARLTGLIVIDQQQVETEAAAAIVA